MSVDICLLFCRTNYYRRTHDLHAFQVIFMHLSLSFFLSPAGSTSGLASCLSHAKDRSVKLMFILVDILFLYFVLISCC